MKEERKHPRRLNVVLGDELHLEIKRRAAERGISIKAYALRALMEQIKREKQYE